MKNTFVTVFVFLNPLFPQKIIGSVSLSEIWKIQVFKTSKTRKKCFPQSVGEFFPHFVSILCPSNFSIFVNLYFHLNVHLNLHPIWHLD